jgi:hypothetical protein
MSSLTRFRRITIGSPGSLKIRVSDKYGRKIISHLITHKALIVSVFNLCVGRIRKERTQED